MKTDLQKFIDLYKEVGIELEKLHFEDSRLFEGRGRFVLQLKAFESGKVCGYTNFFTEICFDENENFIGQGIWE